MLDNPKSELSELLKIIKGPDFSNHAPIIASEEELEEIYSTGRGGFKAQAHWEQEKNEIIINAFLIRLLVQKFSNK